MKKVLVVILILILAILIIRTISQEDDWICVDGEWIKHGYPSFPKPTRPCGEITSFEECVAAGNPVMESYPRQCRTEDGNLFVEEIDDFWRLDSIELMQHGSEGFYGCFGCSTPEKGPALCVDPIPEMKIIEETPRRYCDKDFEVISTTSSERINCTNESRNADACIEIYQPVCGWSDPEKIQCIKYPCANTYSNSCFACQDENILYYTQGECPK